jgi:hypothetical protein
VRLEKWIGPAFVVAGSLTLAAVLLRLHSDRGSLDVGLLYAVSRYDQTLPLLGLGLALAQTTTGLCLLNLLIFAAAIPAGGLFAAWLAAATTNPLLPLGYVLALGPSGSVVTGLVLVAPAALRRWMLPFAALLCGAGLGLVVDIAGATPQELRFAAGAILAGCWILSVPILLWRGFARNWFPIAARIFGSWLIAVGAMLGALVLIRF